MLNIGVFVKMQSDAELVDAVIKNNKEAFSVLVKRYERLTRAVAMNLLNNHHDVQDVTQDAFILAYQNLITLRKGSAFGPWLIKIVRRCALKMAQQKPQKATFNPSVIESTVSKNSQLDKQEQRLLEAVVKLPENEKQIIALRYFSKHSTKDVANILGRNIGTVTKQLSRAHGHLRNMLKEIEL